MGDFIIFNEEDKCSVGIPYNQVVNKIQFTQFFRLKQLWTKNLSDVKKQHFDKIRQRLDIPDELFLVLPKRITMSGFIPKRILESHNIIDPIEPEEGFFFSHDYQYKFPAAALGHLSHRNFEELPMDEWKNNFFHLFNERYNLRNEIVLAISYEQTWKLRGYSRGRLISSFSLAPDESITLEIFSWDRKRIESENKLTVENTRTTEFSANVTNTFDIARESASNMEAHAGANGQFSLPAGDIPLSIGTGGDIGLSGSLSQTVGKNLNTISDTTYKVANTYKVTREVKVVQTHETGKEERVTRTFRNINGSRTLNLDSFEILENWETETKVVPLFRPCLLVNLELPTFDETFIQQNKCLLSKKLLCEIYRPGIEAIDLIVAYKWALKEFEDRNKNNSEEGNGNDGEENTPNTKLYQFCRLLWEAIHKLSTASIEQFMDNYMELRNNNNIFEGFREPIGAMITAYNRWIAWRGYQVAAQDLHNGFLEFYSGTTENGEVSKDETKLLRELKRLNSVLISAQGSLSINATLSAMAGVVGLLSKLSELFDVPEIPLWKRPFLLKDTFVVTKYHVDECGLPGLLEEMETLMPELGITLDAASVTNTAPMSTSFDIFDIRDIANARAQVDLLIQHLLQNETYYHNSYWSSIDSHSRWEQIKLLNGNIYRYIDNLLIGFCGKKGVFPLKSSSPIFFGKGLELIEDQFTEILKEQEKIAEDISLPTPNVTLETRLGQCDALEHYLHDRREIEKQLAQAEADIQTHKAQQELQETERLRKRNEEGILDYAYPTKDNNSEN